MIEQMVEFGIEEAGDLDEDLASESAFLKELEV